MIVQKRATEAGVESFSPHDFRRTFCSDLLNAGIDIVTVQKLVGHPFPVTTAKYGRCGEETLRRAVQKLGFWFVFLLISLNFSGIANKGFDLA